jgi:XRE family transcriptional regulator, regulator of sulfur utilization
VNTERNKSANAALGKRVLKLREKKGLSQYQLADEANISRGLLIGIEKGIGNPTITTLYALAEALDVKAKDLLD